MPVEIKELHIRVSVAEPSSVAPAGAPSPPAAPAGGREAIIAECIEHVLEVLAAREDR